MCDFEQTCREAKKAIRAMEGAAKPAVPSFFATEVADDGEYEGFDQEADEEEEELVDEQP